MPEPDTPRELDHPRRVDAVRERMTEAGADALVLSDLVSIRYLTGFTGSNALLAVAGDRLLFVTDGRYTTQAEEQVGASGVGAEIETSKDPWPVLVPVLRPHLRVGLEAEAVTWAEQRHLAYAHLSFAHLVPTTGLVAGLRAVKEPGEVARIEAACALADAALSRVEPLLAEGPTEKEFRRALEDAMAEEGSEGPSFETIVASGPNSAKPHARPTDRVIGSDGPDLVIVDFGATVDGYHSDMTRTFLTGEPTDTQRRMVEVVLAAQAAGVEAVGAGASAVAVDKVCRDAIADAGWEDEFAHGTGHGVGLVIHEAPRLSTRSDDTLEAGNVVTVEPGVYLPGHGGVRIEDTVVVTEDGCRTLTRAPKISV